MHLALFRRLRWPPALRAEVVAQGLFDGADMRDLVKQLSPEQKALLPGIAQAEVTLPPAHFYPHNLTAQPT